MVYKTCFNPKSVFDGFRNNCKTLSGNNEIKCGALQKILRRVKLLPYKAELIHELNDDNFDRCKEFCEIMQEVCNQNNGFEFYVLFSEKSTICINNSVLYEKLSLLFNRKCQFDNRSSCPIFTNSNCVG